MLGQCHGRGKAMGARATVGARVTEARAAGLQAEQLSPGELLEEGSWSPGWAHGGRWQPLASVSRATDAAVSTGVTSKKAM